MITPRQCTAARGLLDMKMEELAQAAGVALTSISAFENAKRPPTMAVVQAIAEALEKAGVQFTPGGVQIAPPIYHFDGPSSLFQLLDDVQASMPHGGEVLVENVDDRKSPPELISRLKAMRMAGITFRLTAEQSNTHLVMPTTCYRWIPKEHFKNWVILIYENRVAFYVGEQTRVTVINDKGLANAMRGRFDLVWDLLQPLDIESTAHDLIE